MGSSGYLFGSDCDRILTKNKIMPVRGAESTRYRSYYDMNDAGDRVQTELQVWVGFLQRWQWKKNLTCMLYISNFVLEIINYSIQS